MSAARVPFVIVVCPVAVDVTVAAGAVAIAVAAAAGIDKHTRRSYNSVIATPSWLGLNKLVGPISSTVSVPVPMPVCRSNRSR